jgi:uncharacterized protein
MTTLNIEHINLFYIALLVVAFLYASVGHGGASGYLAIMILFSFSITAIKINALVLNCIVSFISFLFFYKAKKLNFKLFISLAIPSIPASFLGSYLEINQSIVKIVLGAVLFFSVLYLNNFITQNKIINQPVTPVLTIISGFIIGFISGMIGIGGGILLTPLLLILGWATIGQTASITALFIFVNSLAGIAGYLVKGNSIHLVLYSLIPFAIIGAITGSFLGSNYFSNKVLKIVLSVVLIFASVKLIFEYQ